MTKLTAKDRNKLKAKLREKYGTKCHYCGIEEEEFTNIWKKKFYGLGKRGQTLEIEHKDGNKENWSWENLVLACALCNMAKTNFLTYDEFKRVGNVIREIWQERKNSAHSVTA
jgi:5-methylcytosine-specific restriction endonuclease McrA